MTLIDVLQKATVCSIWMEGEVVLGTFIKEPMSPLFTGIGFRSSICPRFIKQINAASGESEESGLTGFYAEVTDVKATEGRNLFVSFDEGKTYHRVRVLTVEGTIISDAPGTLPKS